MDINKKKLSLKYREGDLEYVFKEAQVISDFLLVSKYGIYDYDIRSDIVQECLENLYKKVVADKVDPDKNLFAFIWANSRYRILEILRKENNRKKIATFTPYEELEGFSDYVDYEVYLDRKGAEG